MLGPAEDDDDLPPEHLPFGELLAWLRARLGRVPTLEDMAALRFAQQQRAKRRERRASQAARYRWPRRSSGDVPSARSMVQGVLMGPEMLLFWSAAALLVGTLPGFLTRNRTYDEWVTRPETVLRLADAVRAAPPEPVWAPSPRAEAVGVLAYASWKLDPVGESLAPADAVDLDRRLVAAVNVSTPDAVRRMLTAFEFATEDGERRRLLGELRRVGAGALDSWPGARRLAPGPPLGLLAEPEPEPAPEPAAPSGDDGPPAGPRLPGGRR